MSFCLITSSSCTCWDTQHLQATMWSFQCSFRSLPPVSITCFKSKGKCLSIILARFNWLHSALNSSSSSEVLLDFSMSHPLTEIVAAACREAALRQVESVFLFLSVTGDRKWGSTRKPNTDWIYIEGCTSWFRFYLPPQANTRLHMTADHCTLAADDI